MVFAECDMLTKLAVLKLNAEQTNILGKGLDDDF